MARQIPVINGPIVQSTNEASASSIMERDSNGDVKAARPTATVALVSEGGLKLEYKAKTSSYTALESDYLIAANATSAAVTITLPAAASSDGQVLVIKKTDSSINRVEVDGNASETIDGLATLYLTLQYESITVLCDATGWHVVQRTIPQRTRALSATESMTGAANVLLCTAAADITITLPSAAYWIDKTITVKKVDAGTGDVIVDAASTETIDGALTIPTGQVDERYETRVFLSDGTNWHIVSDYNPD
jgi:hypothetical protein